MHRCVCAGVSDCSCWRVCSSVRVRSCVGVHVFELACVRVRVCMCSCVCVRKCVCVCLPMRMSYVTMSPILASLQYNIMHLYIYTYIWPGLLVELHGVM